MWPQPSFVMGWFASKVMNWATAQQEKEILDFVQRVSAADSSELGLTVAMAKTYRHIVRRGSGIDIIHPALALLADPLICTRLNREIRELQRNKQFADAAPVIIWLHSMRASQDLKLRPNAVSALTAAITVSTCSDVRCLGNVDACAGRSG